MRRTASHRSRTGGICVLERSVSPWPTLISTSKKTSGSDSLARKAASRAASCASLALTF